MEALPFHDHVQNEANEHDDNRGAEADEGRKEEICNYTPVKIDTMVIILCLLYALLFYQFVGLSYSSS